MRHFSAIVQDHIQEFMKREVGLDVHNSNEAEVQELAEIIDDKYYDDIYHDNNSGDLLEYWQECLTEGWELLIFEPSFQEFNAYRGENARQYKGDHPVMTAAQILGYDTDVCSIEENEIMNLFT